MVYLYFAHLLCDSETFTLPEGPLELAAPEFPEFLCPSHT